MRYSLREKSELLYEEHKFGGKQSEKHILGSLSPGLSVFGFLILKYSHSILVVCVGSIFFMKPCTVYPGRNFERKGGYDEWLSFERSSSRYNKAHPMQKKSRTFGVFEKRRGQYLGLKYKKVYHPYYMHFVVIMDR